MRGLFLVGPFRPLIFLLVDWDYMEEVEERVGDIVNYEKVLPHKQYTPYIKHVRGGVK